MNAHAFANKKMKVEEIEKEKASERERERVQERSSMRAYKNVRTHEKLRWQVHKMRWYDSVKHRITFHTSMQIYVCVYPQTNTYTPHHITPNKLGIAENTTLHSKQNKLWAIVIFCEAHTTLFSKEKCWTEYIVYLHVYIWYTHPLRRDIHWMFEDRWVWEWVWREKFTLIDSNIPPPHVHACLYVRYVYVYIIVMSGKFEEYIDNVLRMNEKHHSDTSYDAIVWNMYTFLWIWMFFDAIINRKMLFCSLWPTLWQRLRRSFRFLSFMSFISIKIALFCLEIFLECNLMFATDTLIHPFWALYTHFQHEEKPSPPNEIN